MIDGGHKSRLKRVLTLGLIGPLVLVLGAELGLRMFWGELSAYRVWRPGLTATFRPAPGLLPGVEGPARFVIGPEGFRGDRRPPAGETPALLAVGGSTTECRYLDHAETWPQLVQESLSREGRAVWVPNAGRSGRNLRDHVVQLTHLLPQHPDLHTVLLLSGVNDLQLFLGLDEDWEPTPQGDPEAARRQLGRSFEVLPIGTPELPRRDRFAVTRALTVLDVATRGWQRDEAALTGGDYAEWRARRAGAAGWRSSLPPLDPFLADYAANLRRAIGLCRDAGTRLVLLTQPFAWSADLDPAFEPYLWLGGVGDFQFTDGCEYYTAAALAEGMAAVNRVTLSVAAAESVEAIDTAGELGSDPAWYYDGVHFNEAGARRVAEIVGEALLKGPPF